MLLLRSSGSLRQFNTLTRAPVGSRRLPPSPSSPPPLLFVPAPAKARKYCDGSPRRTGAGNMVQVPPRVCNACVISAWQPAAQPGASGKALVVRKIMRDARFFSLSLRGRVGSFSGEQRFNFRVLWKVVAAGRKRMNPLQLSKFLFQTTTFSCRIMSRTPIADIAVLLHSNSARLSQTVQFF